MQLQKIKPQLSINNIKPKSNVSFENLSKDLFKEGDVILFKGESLLGRTVRLFTRSKYNHSAVVTKGGANPEIIESNPFGGVVSCNLWDKINDFKGKVTLKSLSDKSRKTFDKDKFQKFMKEQLNKAYDYWGVVKTAIKKFLNFIGIKIKTTTTNINEFFCSQLVAAGLKKGKVVSENVNPSNVFPKDIDEKWNIFKDGIDLKEFMNSKKSDIRKFLTEK